MELAEAIQASKNIPGNTAVKLALNRKVQVVASPASKAFRKADMHTDAIGQSLRIKDIGSRTRPTGKYPREMHYSSNRGIKQAGLKRKVQISI